MCCRTNVVLLALVVLYVGMAHSWDIAVSLGNRLEFYTNGTKTDTVHFKSHNLTVITYDEVHNMMLFVDKQVKYDAICGYHLDSTDIRCFVKRTGSNIRDIAFDPATELLFFTDTKGGSINSISLKDQESKEFGYRNQIIWLNMNDRTLKNIAVDSCRGYIYWTNTYIYSGVNIERARFDGSEREVVYKWLPVYSFAIDPQTHTNYYIDGAAWLRSTHYRKVDLRKKYLNAENCEIMKIDDNSALYFYVPSDLTVSNDYIYWMNSSNSYSIILQVPKKTNYKVIPKRIITFYREKPLGIAANYRIRDQVQGLQDCEALSSLIPITTTTEKSANIEQTEQKQQTTKTYQTTEAERITEVKLTCVHGLPVCKCIPGYTGERCNVSVCEDYCMQGSCSFNNDGFPKCRCNVGYAGERCELNSCNGYCLNDGNCSFNEKNEPVCQCKGHYVGDRCEVSRCLNYCLQGRCGFNDEGHPECRCNAGYSGNRCEVNLCNSYCLNNGECILNEEDEPVCECVGNYEGLRCESVKNDLPVTCQ